MSVCVNCVNKFRDERESKPDPGNMIIQTTHFPNEMQRRQPICYS